MNWTSNLLFLRKTIFYGFQRRVRVRILIIIYRHNGCQHLLEKVPGVNWLGFCGIDAPLIPVISIEQQFAEKLHSHTLPREILPCATQAFWMSVTTRLMDSSGFKLILFEEMICLDDENFAKHISRSGKQQPENPK